MWHQTIVKYVKQADDEVPLSVKCSDARKEERERERERHAVTERPVTHTVFI